MTTDIAADPPGDTLLTEPPAAADPPGDTLLTEPPAAEGAPESYDFAQPEGHVVDAGVIGKFSEVAKELNLSQANAQKVLDVMAPAIAERQAAALQTMTAEWAETSRADKEFGGDQLAENLATAKTALEALATPEFRTLLNQTGLGNHPEVLRVFYRAGKAISPDRIVTGKAGPADARDARSLYPNSNLQ